MVLAKMMLVTTGLAAVGLSSPPIAAAPQRRPDPQPAATAVVLQRLGHTDVTPCTAGEAQLGVRRAPTHNPVRLARARASSR